MRFTSPATVIRSLHCSGVVRKEEHVKHAYLGDMAASGMRQTELNLSKQFHRIVDEFRSKGLHRSREFNRAHILAALDERLCKPLIMQVSSVGRSAFWRALGVPAGRTGL